MCKHVRATKKRSKSLAKQADFVINNLHNTSIIPKCNNQWATTYALPPYRCPPLSSPAGLLSFDFPHRARHCYVFAFLENPEDAANFCIGMRA